MDLNIQASCPSTHYSRSSSSSSRHNYAIYRDADVEHLIETSPPRSYHDTDNIILDGSGARSRVSRARSHLKDAEQSAEAVQKRSDMLKFNNEQCKYLCDKLCVVIQCASSFLKVSERKEVGTTSGKDGTDFVEIFELLMVLGKQIESFVEGCCKENWIQAAMVLTNVSEYVSSLGFNLHLCEVAFGKDHAAAYGCLTVDEVDGMKRSEAEVVEVKASVDAKLLIEEVVLTQNSLKGEDRDLASYLLQRLLKIKRVPSFGSGPTFWSILFDRVKLGQQVGRGASATVYTARWLGTCVAIKTFNGPENVAFVKESQILSRLCHPNITSMFYCTKNKRICSIIMELMDGDLNQLMLKRCEDGSDSRPFPILEAVDIMLQTGEGVNYLHNQGIVHRDLKSRNILYKSVNGKNVAIGYVHVKVADFGISKARDTNTTFSDLTANTGTLRWMPPEVIGMSDRNQGERPKYPFKLDSYSFGLLCFEILVGREPFWECGNSDEIKRRVLNKERPILPCKPSECPLMLKSLIEKCWSHEPEERPTFGVICRELTYIKYSLMTGGSMKHDVDSKITKVPEYSAGERATVEHLLQKLRSGKGDMERAAAGELRLLAKRCVDNSVCIAEAGAIPLLTELLSSQDLETQEHAVTALLNLSINDSNKEIIVNCGAIEPIVEVLKNGGIEARENAAATLFSLSLVDENKVTIGSLGAIPALVDLLKGGTSRGKKDAATALFSLSMYQGNKARAVRAGVVPPLMGLLRDPSASMVDESLAILAILSTDQGGRFAIGQAAAVPVLVDLLKSGSPRSKENAAAVLLALTTSGPQHLETAYKLGAQGPLHALVSDGTVRARRKAAQLLEQMRIQHELEWTGYPHAGTYHHAWGFDI